MVWASAGKLGQARARSRRHLPLRARGDRVRAPGATLVLVDAARDHVVSVAGSKDIRLVEDRLDIGTCQGAANVTSGSSRTSRRRVLHRVLEDLASGVGGHLRPAAGAPTLTCPGGSDASSPRAPPTVAERFPLAAALGVAAVLDDPERFAGRTIVTIACGGNADMRTGRAPAGVLPVAWWGWSGVPAVSYSPTTCRSQYHRRWRA